MEEKISIKFMNFSEACNRLEEILKEDENQNEFIYDATIQRFEFTFELAWKLMKEILENKGFEELYGPKPTLKEAYNNNLIADIENWNNMLKDRNLTSHIYNEKVSKEIYYNIKNIYCNLLKDLLINLGGEK